MASDIEKFGTLEQRLKGTYPFGGIAIATAKELYDIDIKELIGRKRDDFNSMIRFHCYVKLKECKLSSVSTGSLFNRNHTTILHGIKAHSDRLETEAFSRLEYERFSRLFDKKLKEFRDDESSI